MRDTRHANRVAWLICAALVAFVAAFGAGCGDSDSEITAESLGDPDSDITAADIDAAAEDEGEVDLVAWAGYVEDGSTKGIDWVSDFENETGCNVKVTVGGTSDEMVDLIRGGGYDGVSASGNATARLVAGGDVAPVDVDRVPNYETVFDDLKDQPYNTFDGTNYGIPHGRGANLLMWRTDEVSPSPTSWDVVLDPDQASQYAGKISVYDDAIYIADAAVYLKAHEPSLGIENPYELDEDQFNAAVDLLKEQQPNVGEYWSDALKQITSFTNGDSVVGTTWQYQYFALKGDDQPIAASPASQGFLPDEGATGWSDTWMITKDAEHPACMYLWMNHIIDPKTNAEVAAWFGEAPAQSKSCDEFADLPKDYGASPTHCQDYHADDPGFWKRVYYWETPLADCGDERGEECVDYNEWTAAWTEIKG